MSIRFLQITSIALISAFGIVNGQDKISPQLDITGSIQLQAQKSLWDNAPGISKRNNLDEFWGRANFGAKFKSEKFSSELNIRAFPEGWGYEPLTGLVVKDSTDTVSMSTSKTSIAKFQIEQAWVKYTLAGIFDVKIGRFYTSTSKTLYFGSFVDLNAGGSFAGKISYHNALDLSFRTGILSSELLFGAGDKNLNTGYLRVWEQISPVKALTIGAGYRVNVFDLAFNEDAQLIHRISFLTDIDLGSITGKLKDLKPYVEVGMISNSEDGFDKPFLIGLMLPTGGILSACALEMEYLKDRTVKGKEVPFQWNLYLERKFGIIRVQAALNTDVLATSSRDMRLAIRFTSTIK